MCAHPIRDMALTFSAPLLVLLVVVLLGAGLMAAGLLVSRLSRETLADPAAPKTMAERYNCSQSWATCPGPDQMCYWGDQSYNKGRCCRFPWSGTAGCVKPDAAANPKPEQCPPGSVVHDDGTCWDHKGSANSDEWATCDKAIARYQCPPPMPPPAA